MNKLTKLLTGVVLGAGVAYGYEKHKENKFKEEVTYWINKLATDSDMDMVAVAKIRLEAELNKSDSNWHDFVNIPDDYANMLLYRDDINTEESNTSDEI